MQCIPLCLQEVFALSGLTRGALCLEILQSAAAPRRKKGFSAGMSSEEVDGGKGGGLGFAGLGGRGAGAMGDKNKEDAECDQMQKENKGKKVAGTKGVKRAQKIRSGAEGGEFPCCSFCESF